jgi:hypothetical protein
MGFYYNKLLFHYTYYFFLFAIHSFLASVIDKVKIVIIIALQRKHKGQNAHILNVSWYIKYQLNIIQPADIIVNILKCFFIFPKNQSKATINIIGYTNNANTGKGIQYI